LSRTMNTTVTQEHLKHSHAIRKLIAIYMENEELIRLGAYKKGTDAEVDLSIDMKSQIDSFLQQDRVEHSSFDDVQQLLKVLNEQIEKGSRRMTRR
ncbi:MAG: EscN/YscN/HrcN family type III secretion system ATPase, partial [Myxococcota bacterium]|nr:EscN/YscN/HrcN family type III secretion system ATPase [Myxococcota bacterium]